MARGAREAHAGHVARTTRTIGPPSVGRLTGVGVRSGPSGRAQVRGAVPSVSHRRCVMRAMRNGNSWVAPA